MIDAPPRRELTETEMAVSANRLELLQIADAVAREKSIDKSIVIAAMADAIQKAARSRYGQETNIRADINPNTGEMKLQRLLEVVETVDDYATQIALSSARATLGAVATATSVVPNKASRDAENKRARIRCIGSLFSRASKTTGLPPVFRDRRRPPRPRALLPA